MWNPFNRASRGTVVARPSPPIRTVEMQTGVAAPAAEPSRAGGPGPASGSDSAPVPVSAARLANVERVGQVAVVTILIDELTQQDGAVRLAELLEEIVNRGFSNLVLDLQNVSFMDSSTIGCLVETLNQLTRSGGRIALVNPASGVAHLFRITRLDRVFPICGDVLAAIELIERALSPE